jgi:hypothetical protein
MERCATYHRSSSMPRGQFKLILRPICASPMSPGLTVQALLVMLVGLVHRRLSRVRCNYLPVTGGSRSPSSNDL